MNEAYECGGYIFINIRKIENPPKTFFIIAVNTAIIAM